MKKRGTPVLDDDDGSLDLRPSKSNPTCGACRTRDSKVWWKAPKGLSTNILCDKCGPNWRRYADLNVRPLREESLPSTKAKAVEKREGTPLTGPVSKRAKVIYILLGMRPILLTIYFYYRHSLRPIKRLHHHLLPIYPYCDVMLVGRMAHRVESWNVSNVNFVSTQVCIVPTTALLQLTKPSGCCGVVVDPANINSWICELCQNEETLEASLVRVPISRSGLLVETLIVEF